MARLMDITGVRFQDAAGTFSKHTRDDYNMYLTAPPEIGTAMPKTVYVDVPGADGKLDLTESVSGEISYENRTIKLEFAAKIEERFQENFIHQVNGDLHGKRLRMFVDRRAQTMLPDYYYEGRVTVAWTGRTHWKLHCVITIDASPYKICAEERSYVLNNSQVGDNPPLIVPVSDWHDVLRERNISAPTWILEFGTKEFPADCFYGFEWVEIFFEKSQLGKTVDVTAYDRNGNSWTHATNVTSRVNSITGETETYVNYSLTSARDNGVNPRTLYRITVGLSSTSANTERLGYVSSVNVKVTSQYAVAYITTDMPSYPEIAISTPASPNGFYMTWNEKGYNANEFAATHFVGTDDRLRLKRGTNIITMRPRDTSANNYLKITYRAGAL